MVVWIIGLSGAGKSVLGMELARLMKAERPNTVFIDGDMVRDIMGNDLGYTIEDRRKNAGRICRLCKALEEQSMNVVCSILSLFPESRSWNRGNLRRYFEVFIDVPMELLAKRQPGGLYALAAEGKTQDVVGVDIPFERPSSPDFVFHNVDSRTSFTDVALEIMDRLPGLD